MASLIYPENGCKEAFIKDTLFIKLERQLIGFSCLFCGLREFFFALVCIHNQNTDA